MSGKDIFKNEAKNIKQHFVELVYTENKEGIPLIVGDLVLKDHSATIIDIYSIKILPSDGYPNRFPLVYETGGRIPINIDWHVFPDGHCCIKSLPEEIVLCKNGITLRQFIEEQLIPYFFNQRYREENGFFLNERSHGVLGIIEYFIDYFNTSDITLILNLLVETRNIKGLKSNTKCLCGSERKFKKCHRRSLRALKVFSRNEIESFINSILSFIKATRAQKSSA